MRVVVSAVKGAGKSTTIKFVLEKRPDIKVISVGDYFERVYKQLGLRRDEGDRGIDRKKHEEIQLKVFKTISEEIRKHKDVIIDTNLFFTKTEGYFPGLPEFAIKKIKPDAIVIMEYKPEFIISRREKDIKTIGRERSASLTVEGIEKEQEIQRYYGFVCSALTGCTVKIIRRDEPEKYEFEHNRKNAEEILKLFEK
jgi:adenylate kinase